MLLPFDGGFSAACIGTRGNIHVCTIQAFQQFFLHPPFLWIKFVRAILLDTTQDMRYTKQLISLVYHIKTADNP